MNSLRGEGLRMDFELKKYWKKNFYLKFEIDNINLLVLQVFCFKVKFKFIYFVCKFYMLKF